MSSKKTNYYKEAFTEIPSIGIILGIIFASIQNLHGLVIGLVITQVLYMIIVPNLLAYKRWINLKKGISNDNSLISNSKKNTKDIISSLAPNIKAKCLSLEKKYNEILDVSKKNPKVEMYLSNELFRLEQLFNDYLRLSQKLGNYRNYILNNNVAVISDEIKQLKRRIKNCFDPISRNNDLDLAFKLMQKKKLMEENLNILQKRQNKVNNMKGNIETLQAQIDVIEDTFYLISDHIVSFNPEENVRFDLEGIINNVENTEKLLEETFEEVNKLDKLKMNKIME